MKLSLEKDSLPQKRATLFDKRAPGLSRRAGGG